MRTFRRWFIEIGYDGSYVVKGYAHGVEGAENGKLSSTSPIRGITIDDKNELFGIQTRNSLYLCPMREWRLDRQSQAILPPEMLPYAEKYAGCADYPMEKDSVLLAFSFQERNNLDDAVCDEQGKRFRLNCSMKAEGLSHFYTLSRSCEDGKEYLMNYSYGLNHILLNVHRLRSPFMTLQNTGLRPYRIFLERGYFLLDGRREIAFDMMPGGRKNVRFNDGQGDEPVSESQEVEFSGETEEVGAFLRSLRKVGGAW